MLPENSEHLDSRDPATGELLGSYPILTAQQVESAVVRARAAAAWWRELGFDGRRTCLRAWKAVIARRISELAQLVHRENGKPHTDAVLEVLVAIGHIEWASKHAGRVLGLRRVPSGLLAVNHVAMLEYQPLGVIGVIGPWNYPVFTPMGSIAYALAAGNAVVFKPSEYATAVGVWLEHAWRIAVPQGPDVLQVIAGAGDTGAALARSGVDKIAFTGSTATGRKVMAACAENLVPVLMECGGKDAMIVAEDADVADAADAALWGAMSNAGQTCAGIERVYVTAPVHDAFVAELRTRVTEVRSGSDADSSYGPITTPGQVEVISAHIADARRRGGVVLAGGGIEGPFVAPTILLDVPEDSDAVARETFGPTVTVTKVRDTEEALVRANASAYGLGGAVFTRSRQRGVDLARRMRSGMTSINGVIAFAMVPSLPFGGVGDSGFGRIHGADGLREFARAKAITRQRVALPTPLTTFRRKPGLTDRLTTAVRLLHGRG